MLKPLDRAPDDLATRVRLAGTFGRAADAATRDVGDLRVFVNADGSRQYLRVWETPDGAGKGEARWYEISEAVTDPTKAR